VKSGRDDVHGSTSIGRSHLREGEIVEVPESVEPTMQGEGALVDKAGGEQRKEQNLSKPEVRSPLFSLLRTMLTFVHILRTIWFLPIKWPKQEMELTASRKLWKLYRPDHQRCHDAEEDGYEVCRTLKLDERTSHIPIILLTAKAASENKIEGLEIGADDYLIKPFEPKELVARVKNLINLRRKLRDRFKASVPLKPGEIAVTSMDDVFLNKVMTAVEQHIEDERFHIDELSALVGMSRKQLHRKLTALTNQAPGEFIATFASTEQWICCKRVPERSQRSLTGSGSAILLIFEVLPPAVWKRPH